PVTDGRDRPRLDLIRIDGSASDEERDAARRAIEEAIAAERRARSSSIWLRSSRSHGRRLGMLDYRDRFSKDDAWRLSTRFPFGGREYPGLNGRADAK
ncbi:MAG: hypothetical protein M3345_06040, partial [Actinomycetota bacterium]|nr:hypothetical protein [Actinomycetota bacterium]